MVLGAFVSVRRAGTVYAHETSVDARTPNVTGAVRWVLRGISCVCCSILEQVQTVYVYREKKPLHVLRFFSSRTRRAHRIPYLFFSHLAPNLGVHWAYTWSASVRYLFATLAGNGHGARGISFAEYVLRVFSPLIARCTEKRYLHLFSWFLCTCRLSRGEETLQLVRSTRVTSFWCELLGLARNVLRDDQRIAKGADVSTQERIDRIMGIIERVDIRI